MYVSLSSRAVFFSPSRQQQWSAAWNRSWLTLISSAESRAHAIPCCCGCFASQINASSVTNGDRCQQDGIRYCRQWHSVFGRRLRPTCTPYMYISLQIKGGDFVINDVAAVEPVQASTPTRNRFCISKQVCLSTTTDEQTTVIILAYDCFLIINK